MKWGYLIPRLVVVLLMWGFCQFGFDPTLRLAGQYGLAAASRRQTRVGTVTTQFWPPRMEVAHVEVCEDDRLDQAELTAESIRVEMDEDAFRQRRWIAKEMAIEGVEWNVPAEFEAVAEPEGDAETSEWLKSIQERGVDAFNTQLASLRERVEERLNPDRLETVQLAKMKRVEYETTVASLKQQIDELTQQAERYREIAENADVRRAILLDPARLEAITRDAASLRSRVDQLRDDVLLVKAQVPIDYRELNAAKERDLESLKSEWSDLKANPQEFTELLLGGPMTEALQQVAVWWPRWQRFQDSGDWKDRHDGERRGRTIVFLPEHAGPKTGIRHLLVSGTARSAEGDTPFRLEMGDLAYPIQPDAPASFQWLSDGGATIQAAGLVRLHNDHPELMVQYRMTQKQSVDSLRDVGGDAKVAFQSGPTVVQGTVTLGKLVHGDCQFLFPNASATVRTGDERYDSFLTALDVDAAQLSPEMSFTIGGDQRDYSVKCEGMSSLKDAWSQQMVTLAQQKAVVLRGQAETYLNQQIASLDINGLQINELLGDLPDVKLNNVADLKLLPQKIQQTAARRVEQEIEDRRVEVEEKAAKEVNRFFNRLIR